MVPGLASEIICTFVATRFWLVAALGANQACAGCDLACADARGRERMQGGQVEPGWRKERLRFRGFERLTFRRTGELMPGRRSALCTTEPGSVLPHFQLGNQSEFCETALKAVGHASFTSRTRKASNGLEFEKFTAKSLFFTVLKTGVASAWAVTVCGCRGWQFYPLLADARNKNSLLNSLINSLFLEEQ